jgi:CubicO group peptidase (beta-lactamase class C family)
MKSFLLILGVVVSSYTFAQTVSESFVDSVVTRSMEEMAQAGIAVAVVKDGEVLLAKGYGVSSIETNEKIDEHTLFSIASNSKAFTTTCLGMLVDEGKLNWNDKVVDIIPEFRMYDPYVTENFNIQDLVTHRSGLGLGAGDLMFIPDGGDFTIDDVLTSFQHQEPTSAFRTKYDYDNLLYMVAGEVIHRVSGQEWDAFVEQNIMKPLGMDRSAGYRENLKDNSNVAKPHSSEKGELRILNEYNDPNKIFGAAGGIYASVSDLSKWMIMNLNNGVYGNDTLISERNHDELWKAHTNIWFDASPENFYKTHYRSYGLGWGLKDELGYTIVSHTGGMPGMLSQTILIPELNAGVVVLTNAAPGGYSFISVANEIKDVFIGADDRDWIGIMKGAIKNSESEAHEVVSEVWETVKKNKKVKINKDNFIGTYEDDWFGKIDITEQEGKLIFKSRRSPRLTGEMFYYQANTFAIKWDYKEMNCDAFALFSLDETGKAQSIKMKGISPDIDFSFDFHDLDLQRVEN